MPPSTPNPEQTLTTLRQAVKSGDFLGAVPIGLELTRQDPENSDAWGLLSRAYERTGSKALSLMALERYTALEPDRSDAQSSLVRGNLMMGRSREMLEEMESLQETLKESPQAGSAQFMRKAALELAETYLRIGQLEDARKHLATLTDRGLKGPRILMTQAKIDVADGDDAAAIQGLRALLHNQQFPKGIQLQSHFELAKILDRQGDYDQAFELVSKAKSDQSVQIESFDREQYTAETDRIIKAFGPERIKSLRNSGLNADRAAFIIGMPRSGTTLTEQIIAAHSSCAGLGEQREPITFANLIARETGTEFPECSTQVSKELLARYGGLYLEMIDFYAGTASRVTNKALGLDRFAGLMAMILPSSYMIFVTRNPLDNILSTYLHSLQGSMYPWSRTLEDIALVRMEFDRLVAHWTDVLEQPVFHMDYDRLTEAPESVTRELIEFLGLPFEDECLAFHRTKRLVMTPSFDQVDKPINRKAVNRWKNYEKHLETVIDLFPQ